MTKSCLSLSKVAPEVERSVEFTGRVIITFKLEGIDLKVNIPIQLCKRIASFAVDFAVNLFMFLVPIPNTFLKKISVCQRLAICLSYLTTWKYDIIHPISCIVTNAVNVKRKPKAPLQDWPLCAGRLFMCLKKWAWLLEIICFLHQTNSSLSWRTCLGRTMSWILSNSHSFRYIKVLEVVSCYAAYYHRGPESRSGTSNYIPQILWDVITCPCPWYLFAFQQVSIILSGKDGRQTEELVLDCLWRNDFRRGRTDVFKFVQIDIGELSHIELKKTGSDDWYCEKIIVKVKSHVELLRYRH